MVINNGFNILPWYDSLEKQSNKKWYAFGQSWPLACPQDTILPFQFVSSESISIKSALTAVNLTTGVETNLGITPTVIEGTQANANYYIVKQSEAIMKATLQVGRYYFKMNTDKGMLYSEEVVVVDNISDYIKLEYWNEDTLNFMSGEINFADSFKFVVYIPSTIGKPEYEFEEELTKRLGYKFIESQTSNKLYKFNFLAPEYICDALRLVRMCDYIKLTTKFDTYNALSFSYEPKWQDAGYLAAIDVEFDTDCIIQKLESFNRRAKDSFYNALLAEIDEPVLFSPDTVAQYYTEFTSTTVVNGKLIRQLELINEVELRADFDNIVLPIDNQADPSQKAKKIALTDLQKKIGDDRYLRKDQDDRSKGKIASDIGFEVGKYVAGVSGAVIYEDAETGQTVAELDKLYVRMKAYFETLEIINTSSIGGKQILSPAGAITCIGVDELDTCYRCYFLAEQDGTEVENRWKKDDQAYSKSFNVKTGVTENASSQMYWRLVDAVDETPVEYKGKLCHYIDLSITDCLEGSDIPKSGDIINHRGSRTDIDRQNFVEMSAVDAFSPSITLYNGVKDYDLTGKEMVQFGVEKTTGQAFMHVYGDMYIGDRNESSYIRYTHENGLEVKAKRIIMGSGEALEETIDRLADNVSNVATQLDGSIEIWQGNYASTDETLIASRVPPSSDWDTDAKMNEHLGDYLVLENGMCYELEYDMENYRYIWKSVTDKYLVAYLRTLDTKKAIFKITDESLPMAFFGQKAYNIGDLWVNAVYPESGETYNDETLVCITPKAAGEQFDITHWTPSDGTKKKLLEAGIDINTREIAFTAEQFKFKNLLGELFAVLEEVDGVPTIRAELLNITGQLIAEKIMTSGLDIGGKFVVTINEDGTASVKLSGVMESASSGKRIVINPDSQRLEMYASDGKITGLMYFIEDDNWEHGAIELYRYNGDNLFCTTLCGPGYLKIKNHLTQEETEMFPEYIQITSRELESIKVGFRYAYDGLNYSRSIVDIHSSAWPLYNSVATGGVYLDGDTLKVKT